MATFNIPYQSTVAIGVSGGADSLCLAVLLNHWGQKHGIKIVGLTVNHNLRDEAAEEAKWVATQMNQLDIEHHILTYTGPKPTTRIEEKARDIRYNLLQEFCNKNNIQYICLAHHSDDQSETFFARLARGSGLDGLCAIHPVSKRGDLTLIRPLLGIDKRDILDTLKAKNLSWVEDPMNQDTAFERVRWREHLKTLWQTGLTKTGLLLSAKRLQRAKDALNFYTDSFFKNHVEIDNRGFAKISKMAFEQSPLETRLRVLSKTLDMIGQSDTPLSMEALENALMDFKPRFTLAHCHIITYRNHIFVAKEHARQEGEKSIPAKKWIRWDRFRIWCEEPAIVHAGATKKTHKNIPYLVQQSFPIVETKKTLEKKQKLDYNLNTAHIKKIIEFIVENKG